MVTPAVKKRAFKAYDMLKKKHGKPSTGKNHSVLNQLIMLAVGSDLPQEDLAKSLEKLHSQYIDWNEIRITNMYELAKHFTKFGIPDPLLRVRRMKKLLQDVFQFERLFTFEKLQDLTKDQTRKTLLGLPFVDHAMAAIAMSNSLDIPITPVSTALCRTLKRIGVLASSDTVAYSQKVLDEYIPPEEMFAFYTLFHQHGMTVCIQDKYDCFACFLKPTCKAGTKAKKLKPVKKATKKVAKKATKKTTKKKDSKKEAVKKKVAKKTVAKKTTKKVAKQKPEKKTTKKAAPKKPIKKTGKKTTAKKPAKKTNKKVAPKKTGKKAVAQKKPAKKTAKKPTKKTTKKKGGKKK